LKIIITGFGSFLDNDENPTREILRLLPASIYGNEIMKIELPVVFDKSFEELLPIIKAEDPDVIINLGLAGGRKSICLERVAINVSDTMFKDNLGNSPRDKKIKTNGENAYFSTLPIRGILDRIKAKKTPVIISNSAGTYVCNNLMYHVLHYIKENKLSIKAGFIHVPYMSEQVSSKDDFSLELNTILEAIIDAIKACIE